MVRTISVAAHELSGDGLKERLSAQLHAVRSKTLWLLNMVSDDFLKVRIHSFYSPIGWHFGHVGRTEEYWISHRAFGNPVIDDHLSFLFADLPENPKGNRVNIPSRDQILEYLDRTRTATLTLLASSSFEESNPFLRDGYAWQFAIQHECQHQETICELLQLINKRQLADTSPEVEIEDWMAAAPTEYESIPGGNFEMGSDDYCGYDNEKEQHTEGVKPFKLAKTSVTACQWLEFMRDRGYQRTELWSEKGWEWRLLENAGAPEYWVQARGGYAFVGPKGHRKIHPREPVGSISWFEAEAFLNWCGKRFPTEVEWEYAARWDPVSAQSRRFPWGSEWPNSKTAVFGIGSWSSEPVGSASCSASACECLDMAGNLWEWTSSKFLPYPGFEAFPYDGYSKDHMRGDHYVCRGGSWATAAPLLRCSFRNWYIPSYRQGFLGLRCADD